MPSLEASQTIVLGLGWSEILVVSLATAAGVLVQGTIGFGFGLLAAPVLVAVDPVFVPGPILVVALGQTLAAALREPTEIATGDIAPVLLGRIPGTIVGACMIVMLPGSGLVVSVGVLVILAVIMSVIGLRPPRSSGSLRIAGFLSGFMSTVSSVGGPPLALVYQHENGSRLRGTLAAHFVLGCSLSLLVLALAGRLGSAEIKAAIVLTPSVAIGFALSYPAIRWMKPSWGRPAVLGLSALAGGIVVVRELFF